jgi:hypothetical protein
MKIEKRIALLDRMLGEWREPLGEQYDAYRNHVYRMLNYCFTLHECTGDDRDKLIIAGCFHDLGIWPDDTIDYLPPSIELANQHLKAIGRAAWIPEITLMIDQHHKVRPVESDDFPLVELFRKADWIDVSLGLHAFGVPRGYIRCVMNNFPNLGFHRNLARLTIAELKRNPRNPLPMMTW